MAEDTRSLAQRFKDDMTGLFEGGEPYVPPIKRGKAGKKPSGPAVPYDEASSLTSGEEQGPRLPVTPAHRVKATTPATKTPAAAPPPKMAAKPKPKPDQFAEIRADLMANAKADAAAKAMAERKRKDAEAFSAKLKGATKKGSNRTGYAAYKSLMGE